MSKERNQIEERLTWNTKEIVPTIEEWESEFSAIEASIDSFSAYKGKLGDEKTLYDFFVKQDELSKRVERIYLYAFLEHDRDTRDSVAKSLSDRVQGLLVKFGGSLSFVTPELTSLSEKVLKSYLSSELLKDYSYQLKIIIKNKEHVLSEKEEALLAAGGNVFRGFNDVFTMINNADLPFPKIALKDGKKVTVSHGMYGVLLADPDQDIRKKAFKAYYKAFIGLINTISATYAGNVNKDVYFARVRKYKSCLDYALSNEDVSVEVYENLLKAVNKNLPAMHKYVGLRKKALGVEKLHMYDLYVPIVEGADLKMSYDEAFRFVKKGLSPLGEEYANLLETAYQNRWIDVEETAGKRSGAYSIGIYGQHPYVLLNYQETTHDVFTIAHELGHSMHSYFSNKYQPYAKADYKIFVAEVASTVNEMLLLRYVMKTVEDAKVKKFLLSYFLDMIRTTLFRQTMFAEFEYIAHDKVEKGEPLNNSNLNAAYYELNKKYYGSEVISDKEIAYEWARIPHFYRSFYVYKYATGLISAMAISEKILNEGDKAREDYFKFLKSGSSDSPVELLKIAGVDLTDEKTFDNAMKMFTNTVEELEALI